jgi:hypothetical protein
MDVDPLLFQKVIDQSLSWSIYTLGFCPAQVSAQSDALDLRQKGQRMGAKVLSQDRGAASESQERGAKDQQVGDEGW